MKHYNFVDFSRFGSAWSPTYFNVVRDPVDRVNNIEQIWKVAQDSVDISDRVVVLLLARGVERGRAEAGVPGAALAGSKDAQDGLRHV